MKKILGGVLISALAITGGASPAFAADPATLTISGGKDAVLTLGDRKSTRLNSSHT